MGLLGLLAWILATTFMLIRHWKVVNIDRVLSKKGKQRFWNYLMNDLDYKPSFMFIETYRRNYKSGEANNLVKEINILTYLFYILVIVAFYASWRSGYWS
uniref:hypothetical protein n=1 Tax=Fulvivirga sp. TaxID=1931237 RepID=UPI004049E6C6